MAHVISLLNQKGGVGKTTIALNLVGELALRGFKVLGIDNDAQGNFSATLRAESGEDGSSTSDLYAGRFKKAQRVMPNVWICPADSHMASAQFAEGGPGLFAKIVRSIATDGRIDFIVIDNTPLISNLTYAGILAADHWLIPAMAEPYSMQGMAQVHRAIKDCSEAYPEVQGKFLGIVFNLFGPSVRHWKTRNALRKKYPDQVFETTIKRRAAFVDAISNHLPVVQAAPKSKAADDIRAFTSELLNRIGVENVQ
ncbi:ParA family protein [Patescibacteria group bacterium]|nr:ParA family protein [Patescibacteria group bacterium]